VWFSTFQSTLPRTRAQRVKTRAQKLNRSIQRLREPRGIIGSAARSPLLVRGRNRERLFAKG
ncbi:hypothetical protein, partial [Treponema endosymbiont of Eucomonympha sp.]|uniref:hypothetical protein n=1 Tax=Treponema endosymbiont of Eucomonympha sp. TaxID=1580831 RepID=UPI00164F4C4F